MEHHKKEEKLNDAKNELKRIDHSVFVSLKYTRTVDVLKSIVKRMISFFNFATSSLLEVAVESGKIDSMPTPIPLRCRLLKEIYADTEYSEKVNDMMDLFILLRKINLVENYDSINEYRRHVAMISEIEGEEVIVNLDIINDYYHQIKSFIDMIKEVIYGKEDD